MGGLGNVLYQINFAYFLKEKGYEVIINTSLIEKNWLTKIAQWKVHGGTKEAMLYFIGNEFILQNKPQLNIFVGFQKNKVLDFIFKSKFFGHAFPQISEIERTKIFFGYFQKTHYINGKLKYNFNKNFLEYFSEELKEKIKNPENVVIHFRVGDKLNDSRFDLDFDRILKNFSFKKLLIISDNNDPKKFKRFSSYNFEVISGASLLEDFKLIQLAKNKILSRSSFSWWAAELSNKNSTVIEPYPFYSHVDWEPFSSIKRHRIET